MLAAGANTSKAPSLVILNKCLESGFSPLCGFPFTAPQNPQKARTKQALSKQREQSLQLAWIRSVINHMWSFRKLIQKCPKDSQVVCMISKGNISIPGMIIAYECCMLMI